MNTQNNNSRGVAASASIVVVALIILGLIGYTVYSSPNKDSESAMETDEKMMVDDENDAMMEGEDSMMEDNGAMVDDDGAMMSSYKGKTLAGKSSVVLDFDKFDYEEALKGDKLIVLYFYANWCPICKEEIKNLYSAFDSITGDDVIGFRVNYNDNQTDSYEVSLAKEFGVAYQHTKVFVKNGERILKSPESWDTDRYTSEINKALK